MNTIKKAKVTYEAVAHAAEAINAAGDRLSVRSVINFLGGGSPNTVLGFLQEWKAGRPVIRAEDTHVDPRIGQIVAEQINKAVAEARAEIEARLSDMEKDAELIATAGKDAEDLADTMQTELEAVKSQNQTQAGQIDQIKADAAQIKSDAEETIKREAAAREAAQIALARAELRLESLPSLEKEIARLQTELSAERTARDAEGKARVAAEMQAAVLTARLEAAQAQTTQAESREQAAQTRASEAERQAQATARELAAANLAVQAGQARLESAARELDDARKQAAAARADAKKSGEEAAELRGRLVAGENKR